MSFSRVGIRVLFVVVFAACGPSGGGADGGVDSGADVQVADAASDTSHGSDAGADVVVSQDAAQDVSYGDVYVSPSDCQNQVQAVIDGGCTRCWPADLQMCTLGNPGAVVGMLHCLTNGSCWDEGDYNSAGPCMQNVINEYGDTNVSAVENAIQTLTGCPSEYQLLFTALAAEMSPTDRASFATCIEAITSCSDANAFQACLDATHYNASLCQN